MTRPISSNLLFVLVVAVALSGFSGRQSLGAGKTCVTCTTNRICLEWSQLGDPVEDLDFRVDCTNSFAPDIELRTGDAEWRIDSWNTEIFEADNIGVVTIDPSVPPAIFNVTIATDTGGVGARNLNTIALVAGAPWTGNSALAGAISGNLGKVSVVERFGNGGEVDFWIGGDVGGLLEIPDLVSLHIEGERHD